MKKIKELLDSHGIRRSLQRIAHQIVERNNDLQSLCIIGMQSRGVFLAREIADVIYGIEEQRVPVGILDSTFYRDDYRSGKKQPEPKVTDIPFDITGKNLVLVDDVLYTGRTVRAALDALFDLGRPQTIQLMVLIDRGHRQLPIRADYVGKKITTDSNQMVSLKVQELDKEDSLWLVEKEDQ